MEMIKSCNLTSHTYDERTADEIIVLVKDLYFHQFEKLSIKLEELEKEED